VDVPLRRIHPVAADDAAGAEHRVAHDLRALVARAQHEPVEELPAVVEADDRAALLLAERAVELVLAERLRALQDLRAAADERRRHELPAARGEALVRVELRRLVDARRQPELRRVLAAPPQRL